MNLLDRKQQEEFFHDYLARVLPQKHGVRVAASSYEEEWSAMRYSTPRGPLIVRTNDIEKPETDVPHRTGFVARLLAETGGKEPQEYIKSAKGLFDGVYANFDMPIVCPGGAEIFAWDSTRKTWPRPFYIRRWVEGPNLAIMPKAGYFFRAGEALRLFHRIRFKKHYASFEAVAKGVASPAAELFAIGKALEAVEPLLPLVTIDALTKLEYDPESAAAGLLSNSFFGNNILITIWAMCGLWTGRKRASATSRRTSSR